MNLRRNCSVWVNRSILTSWRIKIGSRESRFGFDEPDGRLVTNSAAPTVWDAQGINIYSQLHRPRLHVGGGPCIPVCIHGSVLIQKATPDKLYSLLK